MTVSLPDTSRTLIVVQFHRQYFTCLAGTSFSFVNQILPRTSGIPDLLQRVYGTSLHPSVPLQFASGLSFGSVIIFVCGSYFLYHLCRFAIRTAIPIPIPIPIYLIVYLQDWTEDQYSLPTEGRNGEPVLVVSQILQRPDVAN